MTLVFTVGELGLVKGFTIMNHTIYLLYFDLIIILVILMMVCYLGSEINDHFRIHKGMI